MTQQEGTKLNLRWPFGLFLPLVLLISRYSSFGHLPSTGVNAMKPDMEGTDNDPTGMIILPILGRIKPKWHNVTTRLF